jgi:hypothetical protein
MDSKARIMQIQQDAVASLVERGVITPPGD